jgi:hypothetical protein
MAALVHFRFDLVESRNPSDSCERLQTRQFSICRGLAVAEQQHLKVVIEQFLGSDRLSCEGRRV